MRAGINRLLYAFSVYVVPMLIAAATVASLLWSPQRYESSGALPLTLRAVHDESATLAPAAALKLLQQAPLTNRYGTRLAETPIWFTFDAPSMGPARPVFIELPSRHAQTLTCWDASTLAWLGAATRVSTSGRISPVKAGFSIQLDPLSGTQPILCRGTFSGPAYINALAWNQQSLAASALDFEESAALITGGLLTLAVFVFVTALINREMTYVIFAAWLVGNLRLCANALGWDTEWLGRALEPEAMQMVRDRKSVV